MRFISIFFFGFIIGNIPLVTFAQVPDSTSVAQDSTVVPRKKTGVTYTIGDGIETYSIDTALNFFEHYDLLDLKGFQYRNIGNLGSAHFPILFSPENKFGFKQGYNQFDIYTLTRDNLRHYKTKGPYSHLFFLIGLKNEQSFRIDHNQPIGKTFNFAFYYNRVASKGAYTAQETKHNDFAITTKYHSKNEKYDFNTLFIYNNVNVQENGGVADISIFENGTNLVTKNLAEVELLSASNFKREMSFEVHQAWNEGKTFSEKINDSLAIEKFYPTFTLYHDIELGRDRHYFLDGNPDTLYYLDFFPKEDSLGINRVFYIFQAKKVGNRIGIRKAFVKSIDSTEVFYKNIVLEAEAEYVYSVLVQDTFSRDVLNELNVHAAVRSHPEVKEGLQYYFSADYSFLDYTASDMNLQAKFGYAFKKAGTILAFSSYQRTQPDWIFKKFTNSEVSWNNDFNKQSLFTAGLTYEIPKLNFRLTGKFHTLKNLAYWNSDRLPEQSSDNIQIVVGELRWLFWIRHFGWDNLVRIQYLPNTDLIRLPLFWSIHSLFYERQLFKKNLLLRVGIDIKYNTNYSAYGYFPLTGGFHLQNEQQQKFYPILDFFVSIKVKTLRLFLKLDHLNQKMFKPDGYFTAYKYPAPDLSFKVGISWMFYDWVRDK